MQHFKAQEMRMFLGSLASLEVPLGSDCCCCHPEIHPDFRAIFRLESIAMDDRLRVGWLYGSGRGTTRADDAQGTPTQSNISPSILVYKEYSGWNP